MAVPVLLMLVFADDVSVGFHDPALHRCQQVYVLCMLVSKARRHGRMHTIAGTQARP